MLIEVDGFSVNMKAACNEGNASYKVHSWSKEPAIININGVQQSISVSSLIENIKKRNSVVINDIKFETQGFNSAWASAL
ncbi:hypothetical protein BCT44_16650 [Vibrio breoganii]|nr:hypothetical protein BCT44_16650 [Vibrio breoganii]